MTLLIFLPHPWHTLNMCILDCPSPWYYISIWHSPQHRKKLNTYHRMNNLLFTESRNTHFWFLFRLNLGCRDSKFVSSANLISLPQFANIWRKGQKPLYPPASPPQLWTTLGMALTISTWLTGWMPSSLFPVCEWFHVHPGSEEELRPHVRTPID